MMQRRARFRTRANGAVLLTAALLACGPLRSAAAWGQAQPSRHVFDIHAQPLAGALAQFATESGIDIAYRQSLANDRWSSPIQGEYPPAVALQMMLRDTGLSARFTGPRAAIIFESGPTGIAETRQDTPGTSTTAALRLEMAEVRAPLVVGTRDRGAHRRYAMAVQGEIRELLRSDTGYRRQTFRLEIRIAVDRHGVIHDVAIRRPSGEPAWDRHVVTALSNHALSQPPPTDLSEPLMFEVVSDRLADRARASSDGQP